jgi:glycosyltransferase involved in cell wall biosynthesis
VIYIISPFENDVESRGTRNLYLYNLLIEGDQCELITSNFSHQNKKTIDDALFCYSKYKYKVIDVPIYKKNLSIKRFLTHQVFAVKTLMYLLKRLKRNDYIVISSIPPESIFLISILRFFKKFHLHVDVRDIWPDAFPGKGLVKLLFVKYCTLLYFPLRFTVDTVSYVSPSFKRIWISRFLKNQKCEFIPLGYDADRWDSIIPTKGNVDVSKLKLVYIGYLQSQFSLDEIISAVNNMSSIELHVVGDGERRGDYESIASDNIFFHGNLSLESSAKIVKSCDIGVLPIKGNAQMPNKIFDFLGAGIPVVSLGDNDSTNFIVKNNIGWVCQFDVAEIQVLLESITYNDFSLKKENIDITRLRYSKGYLYNKFVKLMEVTKT